jgi:hypothetical protein
MSKKLNTLMAMMSVSLAMSSMTNNDPDCKFHDDTPKLSDKEKKERLEEYNKKRLAQAEIDTKKYNGLKEFNYGEHTILALNKKNADKKAKKNGWI